MESNLEHQPGIVSSVVPDDSMLLRPINLFHLNLRKTWAQDAMVNKTCLHHKAILAHPLTVLFNFDTDLLSDNIFAKKFRS